MRVHLLANPAARHGAVDASEVVRIVRERGHHVEQLTPATADDVASSIQSAPDIERLLLVGGDGLIHHALPALAEQPIDVGIVPSGTGNDFSRSVGLPRKLPAAVQAALGDTHPVDLMRIDFDNAHAPCWAASVLTAGFSARVNARADRLRFPRGQQKYTIATLREAVGLRPIDATIDRLGPQCTFFAIGNTAHFGGGMAICPAAQPTDGNLHLTWVDPVSSLALLRMLPTVFFGRHVRHPAVTTATDQRFRVTTAAEIWADGERLGSGPASVQVAPGALRLARAH